MSACKHLAALARASIDRSRVRIIRIVTSTSQGQKFQKFEKYRKSVRIKMADLAGR